VVTPTAVVTTTQPLSKTNEKITAISLSILIGIITPT